jgi:hypothetical protein
LELLINNRNSFPTVLKARKSKIKTDLVSAKDFFPGLQMAPSHGNIAWWKGLREFSEACFLRKMISFMRGLDCDQITSQRPHLLTPSY